MSDILNIPQIPGFNLENLQNDLHIGFTGDLKKRLDKARWTDETKATKTFPEPANQGDRSLIFLAHRGSGPLCAHPATVERPLSKAPDAPEV